MSDGMTTPTNWPNPERPGCPMFPERDGWHLLSTKKQYELYSLWEHEIWLWSAKKQHYSHEAKRITANDTITLGCSYGGPVLTPTQVTEMLAGERGRCAKAAQEVSDEYYERRDAADNDDDRVYADERMCAAQECEEAIRNLGDAP